MANTNKSLKLSTSVSGEELEEAYELYEATGSIKAVSERMGISYPVLRAAMGRDPIRLAHVRATRAEKIASRWEQVEQVASATSGALLQAYHELVIHVLSCLQANMTETDMVDPHDIKGKRRLSPMQALQYLLDKRVLEQVGKAGFNAAKISEGMRQIAHNETQEVRTASSNELNESDLLRTCEELKAAGMPIPPGLAQWWEQYHRR